MNEGVTHIECGSKDDIVAVIFGERQKTHGDFADHAGITQELKAVMRLSPSFHTRLTHEQCEALEMIQHKIGRILSGNPDHIDHWADIAGYATLVARRLESPQ